MITIANKRNASSGEYIGRPSPLGNPFTHLKNSKYAEKTCSSRDESVDNYREWLMERLEESDSDVAEELIRLNDMLEETGRLTLLCWCRPSLCHGDVIKEILIGWKYFSGLFPCLRKCPPSPRVIQP
jgi:hypothetical protein